MQSKSERAEEASVRGNQKEKSPDRKSTDRKKNSEIGCWSDQKVKKALGLSSGRSWWGRGGVKERGTGRQSLRQLDILYIRITVHRVLLPSDVVVRPPFRKSQLYTSIPSKFVP